VMVVFFSRENAMATAPASPIELPARHARGNQHDRCDE
jgi:hypothetical protein